MKQRVSIPRIGLEYEAFLFTSIGDDRNGTPLAIASILGRLNLDPWDEAASLAALPIDVAAKRLTSFIEALRDQSLKHPESATLAARLITLLPAPPESAVRGRDRIAGSGAKKRRGPGVYVIWFAIFCILLLGAGLATAGRLASAQSVVIRTP